MIELNEDWYTDSIIDQTDLKGSVVERKGKPWTIKGSLFSYEAYSHINNKLGEAHFSGRPIAFIDQTGVLSDSGVDIPFQTNHKALSALNYLKDKNYYLVLWTADNDFYEDNKIKKIFDGIITGPNYIAYGERKSYYAALDIIAKSHIFNESQRRRIFSWYNYQSKGFFLFPYPSILIDDNAQALSIPDADSQNKLAHPHAQGLQPQPYISYLLGSCLESEIFSPEFLKINRI